MDHVILKIGIMITVGLLCVGAFFWAYYFYTRIKPFRWKGWRKELFYCVNFFGAWLITDSIVDLFGINEKNLDYYAIGLVIFVTFVIITETSARKIFGKPTPRKQSDYSPAKQ